MTTAELNRLDVLTDMTENEMTESQKTEAQELLNKFMAEPSEMIVR